MKLLRQLLKKLKLCCLKIWRFKICPASWLLTVKCWSLGKEGITCRFWKGAKITEVGKYIRKSIQSTKRKTKWETNRGRESRSVMTCTHSHCSTDSDSTMLKSGLRKCWDKFSCFSKEELNCNWKLSKKQKLALPLVVAAHFGHTEMCDLLFLDKGKSNIEDTNSHLWTQYQK